MSYLVTLDVYQGAETEARYRTTYQVEEQGPVSALSKAEQHLNVKLPAEQYAVACFARRIHAEPLRLPVMALAQAA